MVDKKKSFRQGHRISFKHAFEGIVYAFVSQPNLKIHFLLAFVVIILGFILKICATEWLILVLTIFIVWVAEMFNTAMESAIDLVTTEYREEAKRAKDCTAGAVLFAAIGSIIVGVLIFGPKLLERLSL